MPTLPRRLAGLTTPEGRTTLFYATLFANGGAAAVYSALWFESRGLTTAEIGAINAVPLFALLVLTLIVGRIADRAADWRQVIVAGAVIAGVLPLGLFVVDGFWPILIVWSVAALAHAAIVPVIDAAALRMTARTGANFGAMRAWGSIGYLAVILATGWLAGAYGPAAFVPLFAGLALVRMAAALSLPAFRAPEPVALAPGASRNLRSVLRPWFVLPLLAFALIHATHLVLNAFQGILWQEQGLSVPVISALVALTAISEIAMFFAFRRWMARFPARSIILVASLLSLVRWVIMATAPALPVLILLQLSHGFTYAMAFMAATTFIGRWTSDDIAAEAQSFMTMMFQGLSVVTLYGFGWLMGPLSHGAHLVSAALMVGAAVAVWLSMRMQPPAETA